MKNKDLAFNAILAGLYVVTTLINPLGYGAIQFRISEALCLLPFFSKKMAIPIYLGVIVANMMSPLGIADVFTGILCAFIAYELLNRITDNLYIWCILYSIICGICVGTELYLVYNSPFLFNLVSITISQLIITFISAPFMKKIYEKFGKQFN